MTIKKKAVSPASKTVEAAQSDGALGEPASPAKLQIQVFEEGVQLFTKRRFAEASGRFQEAMRGPANHVTDKARSYMQVCTRKTTAHEINPQTAEEFFNYGVERLNARDIDQAKAQFSRALAMEPEADHIRYTMALACGLSGDGDAAYENLKRAIELEPRNRILARQDPEFTSLSNQFPSLRTLLHTDPHGPF